MVVAHLDFFASTRNFVCRSVLVHLAHRALGLQLILRVLQLLLQLLHLQGVTAKRKRYASYTYNALTRTSHSMHVIKIMNHLPPSPPSPHLPMQRAQLLCQRLVLVLHHPRDVLVRPCTTLKLVQLGLCLFVPAVSIKVSCSSSHSWRHKTPSHAAQALTWPWLVPASLPVPPPALPSRPSSRS